MHLCILTDGCGPNVPAFPAAGWPPPPALPLRRRRQRGGRAAAALPSRNSTAPLCFPQASTAARPARRSRGLRCHAQAATGTVAPPRPKNELLVRDHWGCVCDDLAVPCSAVGSCPLSCAACHAGRHRFACLFFMGCTSFRKLDVSLQVGLVEALFRFPPFFSFAAKNVSRGQPCCGMADRSAASSRTATTCPEQELLATSTSICRSTLRSLPRPALRPNCSHAACASQARAMIVKRGEKMGMDFQVGLPALLECLRRAALAWGRSE